MTGPVDPYAVPDHLAERFVQVKAMAEALETPDVRFMVMLTQYFIEGEPYRTALLTVSPTATPNLIQTQDGFACDATFPASALSDIARRRGRKERGGAFTVRLEVRLEDIIQILAVPSG